MTANQETLLSDRGLTPKEIQRALLKLTLASDRFVQGNEIWAASQDWFLEPWGRDTFISLPGLLLSTGRFSEARAVFRHFANHEKGGLIPNRIQTHQILYNTVDASLWFVMALKKYHEVTGDDGFLSEMWPTVENIVAGYKGGTSFNHFGVDHFIGADVDGLIVSPAQATWMDADPSGVGHSIVTPRNGKAVEINALWYSVLVFAKDDLSETVKHSFRKKFWNKDEECLLDVVEGDPHSGALRPNQIIALSHGGELLGKVRQRQVLAAVTQDLLTPGGLRTLSPRDSHYQGNYDTTAPMNIKDWAYHQGTVWPWLIGPYVEALHIVRTGQGKYPEAILEEVLGVLSPLLRFVLESPYGSLPEVFSGDVPHVPGGTRSQAWSVAEVLRVLLEFGSSK